MFISIDANKCKQDGICAMACPMGLISQQKGKIPEAIPNAEAMCVKCGHCISSCPFDALTIAGVQPQELPMIQKDVNVESNALDHLIKKNRSIRAYKTTPVPHELIVKLLDTMRWAPTAANIQPVNWLVIEKAEEVKKLSGLIADGARALKFNPAMVQAWEQGFDVFLRSAPHVLIAHADAKKNFMPTTDCAIALSYFDLLAASYGIGTCWAGVLMIVAKQYSPLAKALQLPEGHEVFGAMMFGYPKFPYHRIPKRNPAKVTWR